VNDGKRKVAWLPSLDRYGAAELNERFRRRYQTPMTASAWTGWFAIKALVENALREGSGARLCELLAQARFDGHKGTPLFFDRETRELQQPTYAYVSNELAETVSVIDIARDELVRTMKVPGRPRGIEALGSTVHVALSDKDRERRGERDGILTLDAATGKTLARYDAGTDPERFVLSKDGKRLFAANEDAGTATVTDLATNRIRATLVVGVEPEGVAISPDGRWVYVTAETSNTVSVIDTLRLKVVSSMLVDPRPRSAAFSPDGARAYVTSEIGGSLSVIDARRHKVIDIVALPPPAKPVGVTVSPDGRTVYVANGHANSVAFVDAASLKIVATVPVGQRPWGVALSPDGRTLYTANGISGDVSVIDTAARRERKRIPTGAGAWGVAISPAAASREHRSTR
jgi:PQQ-dependent catabolism-associated beta-propeller protein